MSTTLTNGLKLPDKGSVDWYADMQNNYTILDGAVGTVAEHTSALAGKAPLVHTHTKSDVTDLLNSNFIPSANNFYDLGSSSYQWNNAYIKSLTINGVACGDILTHNASEFVNVSSNQTIGGIKTFSSNVIIQGSKKVTCNLDNSFIELDGGTTWGKGGSIVLSGQDRSSSTNSVLIVSKSDTNTDILQYQNGELKPLSNNTNDPSLGTSTNKWKTLNGINPGALSLPKTESGRYSFTELSSIPGIGVDNWVLDGGKIVIAAEYVITGWLYVCIACNTDGYVILQTGSYSYPNCFYKVTGTSIAGYASAMIPIVESIAVTLYLKGTSLLHARYYPAAGNV